MSHHHGGSSGLHFCLYYTRLADQALGKVTRADPVFPTAIAVETHGLAIRKTASAHTLHWLNLAAASWCWRTPSSSHGLTIGSNGVDVWTIIPQTRISALAQADGQHIARDAEVRRPCAPGRRIGWIDADVAMISTKAFFNSKWLGVDMSPE